MRRGVAYQRAGLHNGEEMKGKGRGTRQMKGDSRDLTLNALRGPRLKAGLEGTVQRQRSRSEHESFLRLCDHVGVQDNVPVPKGPVLWHSGAKRDTAATSYFQRVQQNKRVTIMMLTVREAVKQQIC